VLDCRAGTALSLLQTEDGKVTLEIDGKGISEATLYWDRVKILAGVPEFYFEGDARTAGLRASEWRATYRLIAWLNSKRVLNSPDSGKYHLKPYQQRLAASVGFRVPLTLVTTSKSAVSEFVHSRDAIVKSLSQVPVGPATTDGHMYSILTLSITKEQVAKAEEEQFSSCPLFAQRKIPKLYELRVVVVGNHVFAFKIHSQEHSLTMTDWRQVSALSRKEPIDLDEDLRVRIMNFMVASNLFTGSLDLIVDTEGEVWFLEVNPDGQWGNFDDLVDGTISRGFALAFKEKIDEVNEMELLTESSSQATAGVRESRQVVMPSA
jgi:glutathione synthase/RimK-type ligase-like ATP-grasp enzyme